MKTMFRTLGIVAVTALFAVACGKSCEDKASDYAAATTTYTTAIGGTDCAAANTAFDAWVVAYNDLCDESKVDGTVEAVTASHNAWLEANECN